MKKSSESPARCEGTPVPQLLETQAAFDSVAADYDGPRGNNELIQDMRTEMWRWLDAVFSPGNQLLDLGCGTGLDAVRLAQLGYRVMATDWSPLMIQRTLDRAAACHVADRLRAVRVGAHELANLERIAGVSMAPIQIWVRSIACPISLAWRANARGCSSRAEHWCSR